MFLLPEVPRSLFGSRDVDSLTSLCRILLPMRNGDSLALTLLFSCRGLVTNDEDELGFTKPSKMLILSFNGVEGPLLSRRNEVGKGEQNSELFERLFSGESVFLAGTECLGGCKCLKADCGTGTPSLDSVGCRLRSRSRRPRSKAFLNSETFPFRCGFGAPLFPSVAGMFGVPSK